MLKFERSQYDRKKGLLKFQIFFGMLEIPDIFLGGGGFTVDAGLEPTYGEKIRVPHWADDRPRMLKQSDRSVHPGSSTN